MSAIYIYMRISRLKMVGSNSESWVRVCKDDTICDMCIYRAYISIVQSAYRLVCVRF